MDYSVYGFPRIDDQIHPVCDSCEKLYSGIPMVSIAPMIKLCPNCFLAALKVTLNEPRLAEMVRETLRLSLSDGNLAGGASNLLGDKIASALQNKLPEVVNSLADAATSAVLGELAIALKGKKAKVAE